MNAPSQNWSLAHDSELLSKIEASSRNIIESIRTARDSTNSLIADVRRTGISLEIVSNDFSCLSLGQYIENRVYEDDAAVCTHRAKSDAPVKSSKADRDALLLNAARICVQNGLTMLRNFYTEVTPKPEDFDEIDDPTFRPERVFRAKSVKRKRILPYIIGSEKYRRSRYAGIITEDVDSGQKSASHVSRKESKVDAISLNTEKNIPNAPKLDISIISAPPMLISSNVLNTPTGPASDNSGLFSSSLKSDSSEPISISSKPSKEDVKACQSADFQASLSARLVEINTKQVFPIERAEKISADIDRPCSSVASRPSNVLPSQTGKKDRKAVTRVSTSKSRSLFDESSSDDNDLFLPTARVKTERATAAPVSPSFKIAVQPIFEDNASTIKLFDETSVPDDKPSGSSHKLMQESEKRPSIINKPSAVPKNLFSTDESEDELFVPKVTKGSAKPKESTIVNVINVKKRASLFDDESNDGDLFSDIRTTEDLLPAIQSKELVLPKQSNLVNSTRTGPYASHSDEIKDNEPSTKSETIVGPQKLSKALFDSDEDDLDLFNSSSTQAATAKLGSQSTVSMPLSSSSQYLQEHTSVGSAIPTKITAHASNAQKSLANAMFSGLRNKANKRPPTDENNDGGTGPMIGDITSPESSSVQDYLKSESRPIKETGLSTDLPSHILPSIQKHRVQIPNARRMPSRHSAKTNPIRQSDSFSADRINTDDLARISVLNGTIVSVTPEYNQLLADNDNGTIVSVTPEYNQLLADNDLASSTISNVLEIPKSSIEHVAPLSHVQNMESTPFRSVTFSENRPEINENGSKISGVAEQKGEVCENFHVSAASANDLPSAKSNSAEITPDSTKCSRNNATKSIFEEDDDDDDDLFSSDAQSVLPAASVLRSTGRIKSLFESAEKVSTDQSSPTPGTSVRQLSKDDDRKKKSLFDDSDSDLELFK